MNYRRLWIKAYGPIPVDEQGRSFEIHHLDGNRQNNVLENLQCLSIEDHYNQHYAKKEYFAANLIANRMGKSLEKVSNWNMSNETRKKMSDSKKGDKNPMKDPANAKKVADALRGRKKSKEAEQKRLETAKKNGSLARTEETKLKMRKPKAKIECPHCKFIGGISTTKRWHFDNCKQK